MSAIRITVAGGSMKSERQFCFHWRLVTLLLTVAWLLWAIFPADAQVKRKVVFGVPVTPPNVIHISPYIANDMGFFAEQGIEADIVTFEGGVGTVRGSVSGGLDITGTSADPAIAAAAKGAGTK